jgi:hypothetical protein
LYSLMLTELFPNSHCSSGRWPESFDN